MRWDWLKGLRKHALLSSAALLASAGVSRADNNTEADLRNLVEQQGKQIEELRRRLEVMSTVSEGDDGKPGKDGKAAPKIDEGAVKKIVGDYLRDNPGAGMPPSVQTGYSPATGFAIRSAP